MCGIAGFLGRQVDGGSTRPLDSLAHRGPDDSGWIAHGSRPAQAPFHSVLLHRRLSILDISAAGHQPMVSADRRITLVFNGEIYNYRELREQLQQVGQVFHTQSDTEVLLHAYATWGPACLNRLIGMFALAIRDERRNVLFLARDFFGMKPLYYVRSGRDRPFAFASEIKALLDWMPLKRAVNPQRLYEYLRWGNTDHGEDTLFADILQVPAAHYLEVPLEHPEQIRLVRYWDLPTDKPLDISLDEAAAQVRALFLQNVRLHLRSDVPVGVALSGGVDSSSIAAAMRTVAPEADLHAISFIADDPAASEERWIDLVGAHVGATVHKVHADPGQLLSDFDRLIYTQDEPFGSTSMYAQYCVFRAAREQKIKVMLDGQGADEMLAGYGQYAPARLTSLIQRGQWKAACQFASRATLLSGGRWKLWAHAARLLLPALGKRMINRWLMPNWLNAAWFRERAVAFHSDNTPRQLPDLHDELRQTLTATSLPQLLRYEDRNSMAASIESRLPFLTPAFAEFVLRLPSEHILGLDGTTKNVFRVAMRGVVPDPILDRRDKIGFATPEARWLKTLHTWVEDALDSPRARAIGAFNLRAMQRDWQSARAGRSRFDFRFWRWVNLIRWADRFNVAFE